jgi:hypothetical protein
VTEQLHAGALVPQRVMSGVNRLRVGGNAVRRGFYAHERMRRSSLMARVLPDPRLQTLLETRQRESATFPQADAAFESPPQAGHSRAVRRWLRGRFAVPQTGDPRLVFHSESGRRHCRGRGHGRGLWRARHAHGTRGTGRRVPELGR